LAASAIPALYPFSDGCHAALTATPRIRAPAAWVASRDAYPSSSSEEFRMSAAALPLAIAGTGYGLIGLLVIILLIVLIVRLI
jgi:hypothetical protein